MTVDDTRYAALVARDPRFDGVFFVGVSTTGIYCRPICPARTPGRTRCTFYDTPALAEAAGFRACFRCRPEIAPGRTDVVGAVDAIDQLVATAAAWIAEGALNDASVDDLGARLGVSARHLRRAMEARLGVSPIALARTHRLGLAKQLMQDTALPLAEIAFAAGFQSVRRFNAVFQATMGRAPSALRRAAADDRIATDGALALRLDYRPPYDWARLIGFFAARAIPGVESVDRGVYRRTVQLRSAGAPVTGTIAVIPHATKHALVLSVSAALAPALMPVVARVRRMFDLDARPDAIAAVLGRDPVLAPRIAAAPGLRLPGAIDGFEAGVRALLGQQVSVAAATTLAGRFAAAFGAKHRCEHAALERVFPDAGTVVAAGPRAIAKLGLPVARAAAIHAFAQAVAGGTLELDGRDLDAFVGAAVALPGIGPWTAHYLAMRALHLPDAFPASDLGVRKALASFSQRDSETHAERWRPFRSYAVMHLWNAPGGSDDHDVDDRLPARRAAARRARRRAGGRVPAADARRARRPDATHAGARARGRAARGVLRGRAARVRPAAGAAR